MLAVTVLGQAHCLQSIARLVQFALFGQNRFLALDLLRNAGHDAHRHFEVLVFALHLDGVLRGANERVGGAFHGVAGGLQARHRLTHEVSFDFAGDEQRCGVRADLLGAGDELLFGAVTLHEAVRRIAQDVAGRRDIASLQQTANVR